MEDTTPVTDEVTKTQTDVFKETRGSDDVKTLSGRMGIWKRVYFTLCYEPDRLLHGSLTDHYMDMPNMLKAKNATNKAEAIPNPNTHNYLLEVLMLTGLPGFLLVLAFSVLLVVRMVRVFFSVSADISVKLLTVPLAVMLVKNIGEAMILRSDDISDYIFFIIAGIFLAYSYELFPEKPMKK